MWTRKANGSAPCSAFFTPLFPYEPLLGRALVVGGSGPDGEETPATLTVDAVRSGIQWEQEEKS
ncbi:hypothetical protein [Paraburkholderia fungorum]|uniref:hypothetical protein n=1 Tax=Paraburkholderia fungorum TaxID=134537 RepID=UPI0038B9A710